MRTEDGHIISKCLNGDSAAFGLLVDKYKASIYALAYSKLRNFHDVEDVTQDVFLTAYQKLRTLRQWDSFLAWLHAMTLNACKLKMRERSRRPDQEFIEDKDPKTLKVLSIAAYREERLDESLHDALDSLPEMYRQVLTLYYLGGMSGKEIARFLRISPATVRQRLGRARSRLKKEMLAMMSAEFEDRKLQATFTFRIVETVKRLKIQPLPRMTGIPWGLSLAAGVILTAIGLSSHFNVSNPMAIPASSPLPGQAKAPETGEIPVDIIRNSQIPFISARQDDGNSGVSKPQNAFFLAPHSKGDTWTEKADMPTGRAWLSTSVVDGKIYAFGGVDARPLSTVEEYDPATNIWTRKDEMPAEKTHLSTSVINGKVYAIGGTGRFLVQLPTVEEYDPVRDKWEKKSIIPTARDEMSACAVNEKIYVIGGWDRHNDINLSVVEEYDPLVDKWARKADMPTARHGFCANVVNGRIYAIGGAGDRLLSVVEEYDPATDKWTRKAEMPTARYLTGASVVNGKIYIIGGWNRDKGGALAIVEEYDPVSDTWTKKANMPTARAALSASAVNGKIYAIGGDIDSGMEGAKAFSIVEEYDPGYVDVEAKGKLPKKWGEIKSD